MKAGNSTWLEVRAEIMRRISTAEYESGSLIPTEQALAEEFGCARATVNRALTSLAQRGVVERRRRIGTHVAEGMNRQSTLENPPLLRQTIEESGQIFGFEYRGTSGLPAPRHVRERLFLSDPADLQEHVTLYLADDKMLSAERRWLDMSVFPQLADEGFQHVTISEWLVHNAGLTKLERNLSARYAGEMNADRLLDCAPDAAVLAYHSCAWIGARPITCARHVFVPGYSVAAFPV